MIIADLIHEQEVSSLQKEVSQLWEQLNQQSDFSSSLGAATATLLWKVSRMEENIVPLLGAVGISTVTTRKSCDVGLKSRQKVKPRAEALD